MTLSKLSLPQMDKVLDRFNLISDGAIKEKLTVLTHSRTYMDLFRAANPGEMEAGFRKNPGDILDTFVELRWCKSNSEIITLFGDSAIAAQCSICLKNVTKSGAKSKALTCSGCDKYFHVKCCKDKVSDELYEALNSSPSYVKTFCDKCEVVITNVNQRLLDLESMVSELKIIAETKPLLSELAIKTLPLTHPKLGPNSMSGAALTLNNNRHVMPVSSISAEEQAEKDARTRVVIKPLDVSIFSSYDIKKAMNKRYKEVSLEACFSTAGGSFMIECEDKENAEMLDKDWDLSLFGGNSGLKQFDSINCVGVIKDVIKEEGTTDEALKTQLREILPLKKNTVIELFTRKNRKTNSEEFTGTVKLTFHDRASLEEAVRTKININNSRCRVEEWINKSKQRFCYKCQMMGHVAHRCRNNKTLCGKCGSKEHGTRDCTVTNPREFKCAHCGEAHITGTFKCLAFKEAAVRRNSRQHGC